MTTKVARSKRTTHAVSDGRLRQLDLPVRPGHLKAVRVVEANVPRITGKDWLFVHNPITFTIVLPGDLGSGAVVEWADAPAKSLDDFTYTVVTAMSATSVTFAHFGRGPAGALAAARAANRLREETPVTARCKHCRKAIRRDSKGFWGARRRDDPHPWYCDASPDAEKRHEPAKAA